MPVFITDMVLKGFWWAILACVIVNVVANILGLLLGKLNKVLGGIVQYLPGSLFLFYVWHLRHGVGWLILGILSAAWLVLSLFVFAKKR